MWGRYSAPFPGLGHAPFLGCGVYAWWLCRPVRAMMPLASLPCQEPKLNTPHSVRQAPSPHGMAAIKAGDGGARMWRGEGWLAKNRFWLVCGTVMDLASPRLSLGAGLRRFQGRLGPHTGLRNPRQSGGERFDSWANERAFLGGETLEGPMGCGGRHRTRPTWMLPFALSEPHMGVVLRRFLPA